MSSRPELKLIIFRYIEIIKERRIGIKTYDYGQHLYRQTDKYIDRLINRMTDIHKYRQVDRQTNRLMDISYSIKVFLSVAEDLDNR